MRLADNSAGQYITQRVGLSWWLFQPSCTAPAVATASEQRQPLCQPRLGDCRHFDGGVSAVFIDRQTFIIRTYGWETGQLGIIYGSIVAMFSSIVLLSMSLKPYRESVVRLQQWSANPA